MKLSEKIFSLRKKAGLSQEELADKLNVSRQAVYKWETEAAKPELEKITAMVQLFNVSYDYLMNDSIDSDEPVKSQLPKKKFQYKSVYCTGEVLDFEQFDIDHGYIEKRKFIGVYDCEEVFENRKNVALKNLGEIGATFIFWLSNASTTAFFFNEHTNVFGFYYGDKVQFACPIENYIGMRAQRDNDVFINTTKSTSNILFGNGGIIGIGGGSAPYTERIPSTTTALTITYHDENEIKEFKMVFNVCGRFLFEQTKGSNMLDALYDVHLNHLADRFDKLKLWFANAQFYIDEILDGNKSSTIDDYELFDELNKKFAEEHSVFIASITKKAKKINKKMYLLIAFGVLVGVVVVVFLLYLFGLFS